MIFWEIFDILSYVTSQKVASNLKFFIFLEMVENTLMILDVLGSVWFGLICNTWIQMTLSTPEIKDTCIMSCIYDLFPTCSLGCCFSNLTIPLNAYTPVN